MTNKFSPKELEFTKGMTTIALAQAVQSLSVMIKDEVLLQNFNINKAEILKLENFAVAQWNTIHSRITGDFEGEAFLIIHPEDEVKICNILLPKSMVGQLEMREAILLELANILTASMVTKYSNMLKVKIYGGVPKIYSLPLEETQQLIENLVKSEESEMDYLFQARLSSLETGINMVLLTSCNVPFHQTVYNKLAGKGNANPDKNKEGGKGLFGKMFGW